MVARGDTRTLNGREPIWNEIVGWGKGIVEQLWGKRDDVGSQRGENGEVGKGGKGVRDGLKKAGIGLNCKISHKPIRGCFKPILLNNCGF